MLLRGVDVSAAQGAIDWSAWLRPADFLFAKCGNGNDAPDPTFVANVDGARRRGVRWVGAYHVVYPFPADGAHPGRDPLSQARAHYEASGGYGMGGGEIPPMVDAEEPVPGSPDWVAKGCNPAQVRRWLLDYLAEAERLHRCTPILYSFPDWWAGVGVEVEPAFLRYRVFPADYPAPYQHDYPTDDSLLVVPRPWAKATFWQVNDGGGSIPVTYPDGTRGSSRVDMDVFLGDEAAMAALCARA
jgi:lysozyme